jgi:hypothetical protein
VSSGRVWQRSRLSGGVGRELVADRVEVDYGGCPRGLQSALGAGDVSGLAGVVAVGEQAERPLDPGSCSAEVLGGRGILERLARGDQQRFLGVELDLPARLGRAAAVLERTLAAGHAGEERARDTRGGRAGRHGVPRRAGDRAGLRVDLEVTLAQPSFGDRRLWHRGEHIDLALGQLAADRAGAIGGVAEQPLRAPVLGLLSTRPDACGPSWSLAAVTSTAQINGTSVFVTAAWILYPSKRCELLLRAWRISVSTVEMIRPDAVPR